MTQAALAALCFALCLLLNEQLMQARALPAVQAFVGAERCLQGMHVMAAPSGSVRAFMPCRQPVAVAWLQAFSADVLARNTVRVWGEYGPSYEQQGV